MRTFEYRDEKSSKFWNITLQGKTFTVTFGKIGSAGQTQKKEFPDEARARKEHDKLVAEKLTKGYVETTRNASAAPPVAKAPAPVAQASEPAPAKKRSSKKSPAAAEPAPAPSPTPTVPTVLAVAPAAAPAAPPTRPAVRTFAFSDAKSHKFWNIDLSGKGFTVTYGRQGTAGQTQKKDFPDEARAKKEAEKLITEKLGKGYKETTPAAAGVPNSLREALESAILANPGDLASHAAYADFLSEQRDPALAARGEFIRVQLALEDAGAPAAERKRLQQQEKKLLARHQADWLGSLGELLLNPPKDPAHEWRSLRCSFTLARGWIDTLELDNYTVAYMRALAKCPELRMLRKLVLLTDAYEDDGSFERGDDIPENTDAPQLFPLVRCPYLTNVRVFQLGENVTDDGTEGGYNCHTDGEAAAALVKVMPRVEELYLLAHRVDAEELFSLRTLDNLRILQLYHNESYPLARLAKNPSLGKLTHLLLHPHAIEDDDAYITLPAVKALVRSDNLPALTHLQLRLSDIGDKGIKEIIDSGILRRLKVLDLRHGCVTDKGAGFLARCADAKKLERIDLTNNCLTEKGISALQSAGVQILADNQWQSTGNEYDDREYLYAGDIE